MRQETIDHRKYMADAIQADAELQRLEAEARKTDANKRIDETLGLSDRRAQFKKRLDALRNSTEAEFKRLNEQYKKDWENFKSDAAKKLEKADKYGNARLDLLAARLDGLDAKIQYLVGQQMGDDANELAAIKKALDPIQNGLRSMKEDIQDAVKKDRASMEATLKDYDQRLLEFTKQTEEVIISKSGGKSPGSVKH